MRHSVSVKKTPNFLSHTCETLSKLYLNCSTKYTSSKVILPLDTLPFPLILPPFGLSPKATCPPSNLLKSSSRDMIPVMCLEQPLSTCQRLLLLPWLLCTLNVYC